MDVSDNNTVEKAGASIAQVLPTPRIDLKTIDDVRVEMARVYRAMKGKALETQDGTRLVYVLSQIGKMIETADIERRIGVLESVQDKRRIK